jgi:pSer/pThr/pTyr-binding forkhead associated (FHA) protein
MRDGSTRKIEKPDTQNLGFAAYQVRWQVSVVVLSGGDSGNEFSIEKARTVLGRGADADLRFVDEAMSSQHAVLEFADEGMRIRDLGSMNGTLVNGSEVKAAELKNGDRFKLGSHEFQLVVTPRERRPKTYHVD